MHIIHGFWLPETTSEFIQGGKFYLWVETDTPSDLRARSHHPNQLTSTKLAAFLCEEFGLKSISRQHVKGGLVNMPRYFPTSNQCPLPSPERDVEGVLQSDPVTLASWHINCYILPLPFENLNHIHFLAKHQPDRVKLGSDFLFWYHVSHALKSVVQKDQYIPSFLKQVKSQTIYKNWEIISASYQHFLKRSVQQMPLVISQGFEPESLIEHFSQVMLNELLESSVQSLPQTIKQKLRGTLLENSLNPTPKLGNSAQYQTQFEHWFRWKKRIVGRHNKHGFQLCLQLHEATVEDPEKWQLEFLVTSKKDPSFHQRLCDYWRLPETEKKSVAHLFGEQFEHHLLTSLGSAARIYPELWKGMQTHQPESLMLTLDQAFDFLKEMAWVLENADIKVIVPAWWTPQGRRRAKIRMKNASSSSVSNSASARGFLSLDRLIEYDYQLSLGDAIVSPEEWQHLIESKSSLVQFRGQWVELDKDKMAEMIAFLEHQENTPFSIPDLIKKLAEQQDVFELDQEAPFAQILAQLSNDTQLELMDTPKALHAELRDYQKRGLSWLHYLEKLNLNGCLADDMGLGKTIQVIALLTHQRTVLESTQPTLLIVPTSVIGNWQKEVEKFAPHLKTFIHHGSKRSKITEFSEKISDIDIVITSYTLARKDVKLLKSVTWHRIVLDEAQHIKNPKAAQTKAVLSIQAKHRLALTGTPVENRLMDLWSIFQFLNPSYLGKQAQFKKRYELPIQRDNDAQAASVLKQLVAPFILRRLKSDKSIIKDLPDKVENKQYCNLSKEQASLYEAVVKDVETTLEQTQGIERKGLMLSTLMKLKQICNHPSQFLQDGSAFTPERSHKLERVMDMIDEALEEGDSLLVFTQFTEIGTQLDQYIRRMKHYPCYYLHGGISRSRREAMITCFQSPNSPPSVFILSLKAGGVGITLTKANRVFHFDRWWNPAVEDQATDRAFRIGQTKNVFVHKMVTLGTLEERIDQMIEDKKQIADNVVGSDESWLAQLDNQTFKELIQLNRDTVI